MMLTADWRLAGIALLVEAVIPLGDMSIILGSGGVEVASALSSWRNLRGELVVGLFVDPCHLREMPLIVLVDRVLVEQPVS